MQSDTHIIKRQLFEVEVARQSAVPGIREVIREVFYEEVLPMMEQYFDELIPPGETLRIEKLELDIGPVKPDELKTRLSEELMAQFRKEVDSQAAHLHRHATPPADQPKEDLIRSQAGLFDHFIQHGVLPWWARQDQKIDLEGNFRQSLIDHADAMKRLLLATIKNEAYTARLINTFSDEALLEAVGLISPGLAASVSTYHTAVWDALAKQPPLFVTASGNKIRRTYWNAIFRYYRTGRVPAKLDVLEAITRQFADHLQATHHQVVRSLRTNPALRKALTALQKRTGPGERTPMPMSSLDLHQLKALTRQFRMHDDAREALLRDLLGRLQDPLPALVGSRLQALIHALEADDPSVFRKMDRYLEALRPIQASSFRDRGCLQQLIDTFGKIREGANIPAAERSQVLARIAELCSEDLPLSLKKHLKAYQRAMEHTHRAYIVDNLPQLIAEVRGFEFLQQQKAQSDHIASIMKYITQTEEDVQALCQHIARLENRSLPTAIRNTLATLKKDISSTAGGGEKTLQLVQTVARLEAAVAQAEQQLADAQARQQEKAGSKPDSPFNNSDEIYISNAGLILLWPFLKSLFQKLDLLHEGTFRDHTAAERAMLLLQYLTDQSQDTPEYLLPLNKLFCGISIDEVVDTRIELTEQETMECQSLIASVIHNWPALRDISQDGFRRAYLQREGSVECIDGGWLIRVEPQPYDILVDQLPWSIQVAKLPWLDYLIYTEWGSTIANN